MSAEHFTLTDETDAIIAEMLEEHEGSDEPFDWLDTAASTERSLASDPEAKKFDPSSPELWRLVASELRQRGEAIQKGGEA